MCFWPLFVQDFAIYFQRDLFLELSIFRIRCVVIPDACPMPRIMSDRLESLEYVETFGRLGKATLARGGSISFEWPRHCEGWREEVVMNMMRDLGLGPIEVDGCAVGVRSKSGEPILKPWIAVSSQHMKRALDGLRCDKPRAHPVLWG